MTEFQLLSDYQPTGDQPQAIETLVQGLNAGLKHQVLLGATGTGKTFTIANLIAQTKRPTLILAHNKTLAAQLYSEFKAFFPHNAVSYFVSYYDYYQPEAYIPRHDLYIEKTTQINEEIERMRLAATQTLATRRDVVVIASVSAIYSLGDPIKYGQAYVEFKVGQTKQRDKTLRRLVDIYYERNDMDLHYSTFRVRGDTLEIHPPHTNDVYRILFWGDEVECIQEVDSLTGEVIKELPEVTFYPARHFVMPQDEMEQAITSIEAALEKRLVEFRNENKLLEAQRLEQRTRYDLEMLRELGYCNGVENYTSHFYERPFGTPPWTLLDYFPDDFLVVVDESHMTIPQIRAMYHGDRSRKETLVEYGFRLPSALDNRPLTFEEWQERAYQVVYTSATPGPYEQGKSQQTAEQIIRPTGLLDPQVQIRPIKGQIDDLLFEVRRRVDKGQRALITTLTKRMAEDLADYLREMGVKVQYLHSEVETLERVEILQDLRRGMYDAVVGINLLREGLDLPEVSLVAILDADKEGFLRSETALIQTIGRAARHSEGMVIMYADRTTDSMQRAIDETNRRRAKQMAYNEANGIVPRTILKEIVDVMPVSEAARSAEQHKNGKTAVSEPMAQWEVGNAYTRLKELEKEMLTAAKALEFEKAAAIRDQIREIQEQLDQLPSVVETSHLAHLQSTQPASLHTPLELNEELAYYASQSDLTNPGRYSYLFDELPHDLTALCQVVRNVYVHFHSGHKFSRSRLAEVDTRHVERILGRMMGHDKRPLTEKRPIDKQFVGCCRDAATLLCAMLRHQGIPARTRVGFAHYINVGSPGFYVDHVVTEYWDDGRWKLVDPEQDETLIRKNLIRFDVQDIPHDQFVVGGLAWQWSESGQVHAGRFGVGPRDRKFRGRWFVGMRLLQDLATQNKQEWLLWDCWGLMLKEGKWTQEEERVLTETAVITQSGNFATLRAHYENDPRLRLSEPITSFSPATKRQDKVKIINTAVPA